MVIVIAVTTKKTLFQISAISHITTLTKIPALEGIAFCRQTGNDH